MVSSERLAGATVVSRGWFQASCSSPATLGRAQRARRPRATGESCRVAPPEGVLFTSGGYVALALGRIFEHAACRSVPPPLGDTVYRRTKIHAVSTLSYTTLSSKIHRGKKLAARRRPSLRGLCLLLRVFWRSAQQ